MALTMDYHPITAYHAEFSAGVEDRLLVRGNRFDATVVELNELTIGHISYPLRRRLEGQYFPISEELIVEGFGTSFTGHGKSLAEAVDIFASRFISGFKS